MIHLYQSQKRKKIQLLTKIFELYQVPQRFQHSQIVYIKSITQWKSVLFPFSHLLACTNTTILGCHTTGINSSFISFLKLVSRFYQTMKNVFYFIWKALFVLEIFKFLWFLPFLSPLSRFKRTNESRIIYDVVN